MADGERKVTKLELFPELPKAYVNVAVYCRVSTSHPSQIESLENQIDYYHNMLKGLPNWKLIDMYVDVRSGKDVSGREAFNRMMDDCLDGKIDLIISKSISRFGRNTIEILQNIKMGIQYQFKSGTSKLYSKPCYGYDNDEEGNVEKYIGNVRVGKTYSGDFPNNKRYVNKGERAQYLSNYTHETIITQPDFERVQEEKVRRSNIHRDGEVTKRKDTHYSMKLKNSASE